MKNHFLFIFAIISGLLLGQVGIGTDQPHSSAILDISSTTSGLLIPRMTEAEIAAIPSPATGLMVYNVTKACHQINIGISVADFYCLVKETPVVQSFYMPTLKVDTSVLGSGFSLDLFAEYQSKYNSPAVTSPAAPASIPSFTNPGDLYYYITSYDSAVFSNVSISVNGVMTYDVIGAASIDSFIEVVFVPKS